MTALSVGAVLTTIADTLSRGGVPQARDEARDIVAALLDVPRLWPTANRDALVDAEMADVAARAAAKRLRGAPFAYAVGQAAFRYLTLAVDERVLIPRQETEGLVELVLARTSDRAGGTAVDIGTGSGAIALALATEGAFDRVIATDISRDALDVAEHNVNLLRDPLRAPVDLRLGAGLGPLAGVRARVLVANPPYIAFEESRALPASVRDWEPSIALFSGENGLAVTRSIMAKAPDHLEHGGLLALEVDVRRASLVAELAMSDPRFSDVSVHFDTAGRERFVLARRR